MRVPFRFGVCLIALAESCEGSVGCSPCSVHVVAWAGTISVGGAN